MGALLPTIVLFGAGYGFALYIRDIVRMARRRKTGGYPGLWPPEAR